jgi:hypothetical protein
LRTACLDLEDLSRARARTRIEDHSFAAPDQKANNGMLPNTTCRGRIDPPICLHGGLLQSGAMLDPIRNISPSIFRQSPTAQIFVQSSLQYRTDLVSKVSNAGDAPIRKIVGANK